MPNSMLSDVGRKKATLAVEACLKYAIRRRIGAFVGNRILFDGLAVAPKRARASRFRNAVDRNERAARLDVSLPLTIGLGRRLFQRLD